MSWQVRHEGSPKAVAGLTLAQVVEGLRDGVWEPTDEVKGPQDKQWLAIENHPQLAEAAADLEPPAKPHEGETHIDMNALIDVTLVLLIFFILTTTHATAVQKVVPVPTVASDAKRGVKVYSADQVKKYMIHLQARADAAGKPVLTLDKQTLDVVRGPDNALDVDRLSELLRPYVRGEPVRTEMLLDAQGVNWGTVIAIQDAAKAAGVRLIHHLHQTKPGGKAG